MMRQEGGLEIPVGEQPWKWLHGWKGAQLGEDSESARRRGGVNRGHPSEVAHSRQVRKTAVATRKGSQGQRRWPREASWRRQHGPQVAKKNSSDVMVKIRTLRQVEAKKVTSRGVRHYESSRRRCRDQRHYSWRWLHVAVVGGHQCGG